MKRRLPSKTILVAKGRLHQQKYELRSGKWSKHKDSCLNPMIFPTSLNPMIFYINWAFWSSFTIPNFYLFLSIQVHIISISVSFFPKSSFFLQFFTCFPACPLCSTFWFHHPLYLLTWNTQILKNCAARPQLCAHCQAQRNIALQGLKHSFLQVQIFIYSCLYTS